MNVRLRRSGGLVGVLIAASLGLALGAGLLAWTRTDITRLRYRLAQLRQAESALLSEVEKLRVEAAAEAAPERLESRARALGLRYPAPGQVRPVAWPEPGEQPREAGRP